MQSLTPILDEMLVSLPSYVPFQFQNVRLGIPVLAMATDGVDFLLYNRRFAQ